MLDLNVLYLPEISSFFTQNSENYQVVVILF